MLRDLPAGFVAREAAGRLLVVDRSLEAMAQDLLAPGGLEALRGGTPSTATGRAGTWLLPAPPWPERVLVRPVLHGGLLGPLLGATLLGLARPLGELRTTARLRDQGAPVPRPAFVLGWRRAGPLWAALVATFFEEQAVDAAVLLASAPGPARVLAAARAAGRAVRRFHDAGGSHADLHLKNLLVREGPHEVECVVVDLDRARLRPTLSAARRMTELMRLFRSLRKRGLLEQVGSRGVARFFSAYVGGDRELRRALRRTLRWERIRIGLHAFGYARSASLNADARTASRGGAADPPTRPR